MPAPCYNGPHKSAEICPLYHGYTNPNMVESPVGANNIYSIRLSWLGPEKGNLAKF